MMLRKSCSVCATYILSVLLSCSVLFLVGCADHKTETEYEKIRNSGVQGNALVSLISDFELNHLDHLISKVDLADYYFILGDYDSAWQYLKRAEAVVGTTKKTDEVKKSVCRMYGLMAKISFVKNDYENAQIFAQKAISADRKFGLEYQYVLGHVLVARNENQQALETFDSVYGVIPERASADDLHAYMYVLADAERIDDGIEILEKYFETGVWFEGLGSFASSLYEANGDIPLSLLCAFLDYEYYGSYGVTDDATFLTNIDTLSLELENTDNKEESTAVLSLIRSLYDDAVVPEGTVPDFFIARYCAIKYRVQRKFAVAADFNELLRLERYFSDFPSYYWLVWETIQTLQPEPIRNYTSVLKKIIAMNPSGTYADKARKEIGVILGLSESQLQKIDTILF